MGPDVHTLTGAYTLDALGEPERRQFEAHLAQCPDCVREASELRLTAARLGLAAAEQPPDRLRQRVLAQVARTRQDSPTSAPSTASAAMITGAAWRRQGWTTRLAAAVASIAAAAAVLLGVVAVRADEQRDAALAELAGLRAQYQAVTQLAAAPDARGTTGVGVNGGTAFVLASAAWDRAVLLVSDLPAPPPGHTYQAWLIEAGHPRSVGLLVSRSNPAGRAEPLMFGFGGLAGASKIGLTVEPAGGSPQPTTTPVVLFSLPA
jgi:anti-sigma-K factor RskA